MVNIPLIRPYFLGWLALGGCGPLDAHYKSINCFMMHWSVFAEVHGKSRMDQEEEEDRPGDRRGESQQLSPWIALLGMLLSDLLRLQFLA